MQDDPDEETGDYSYDMAHEALAHVEPRAASRASSAAVPKRKPRDASGDYSYDLAHDVPRSE